MLMPSTCLKAARQELVPAPRAAAPPSPSSLSRPATSPSRPLLAFKTTADTCRQSKSSASSDHRTLVAAVRNQIVILQVSCAERACRVVIDCLQMRLLHVLMQHGRSGDSWTTVGPRAVPRAVACQGNALPRAWKCALNPFLQVRFFVLDEADRLLETGSLPTITEV